MGRPDSRVRICSFDARIPDPYIRGRGINRIQSKSLRPAVARRSLKLQEAANYLRVPVSKLAPYLKLRGKRRLPAQKLRGRWEIDLEKFHDWLVNLYEKQNNEGKRSPSKRATKQH